MILYYKHLILMLLYFWKAGENKIFHFIYFCFFVSSHDFLSDFLSVKIALN